MTDWSDGPSVLTRLPYSQISTDALIILICDPRSYWQSHYRLHVLHRLPIELVSPTIRRFTSAPRKGIQSCISPQYAMISFFFCRIRWMNGILSIACLTHFDRSEMNFLSLNVFKFDMIESKFRSIRIPDFFAPSRVASFIYLNEFSEHPLNRTPPS